MEENLGCYLVRVIFFKCSIFNIQFSVIQFINLRIYHFKFVLNKNVKLYSRLSLKYVVNEYRPFGQNATLILFTAYELLPIFRSSPSMRYYYSATHYVSYSKYFIYLLGC